MSLVILIEDHCLTGYVAIASWRQLRANVSSLTWAVWETTQENFKQTLGFQDLKTKEIMYC